MRCSFSSGRDRVMLAQRAGLWHAYDTGQCTALISPKVLPEQVIACQAGIGPSGKVGNFSVMLQQTSVAPCTWQH